MRVGLSREGVDEGSDLGNERLAVVVEDHVVGPPTFFLVGHLAGHAPFDGLARGVVASLRAGDSDLERGVDHHDRIDHPIEPRLEQDGRLDGDQWPPLPRAPIQEVAVDDGVDEGVHAGQVLGMPEDEAGQVAPVERAALPPVDPLAGDLEEASADDGRAAGQALALPVGVVDGYAVEP